MAAKGIVTTGEGEAWAASLFVLCRMIRHVGCTLPVQVWGERPDELAGLDVEWRDPGSGFSVAYHRTGDRELKASLLLESGFDEALFLDADCYPVTDPAAAFDWPAYRDAGAIFPPLYKRVTAAMWQAWGLPVLDVPGTDTCCMAVDVARCRPVLERLQQAATLHRNAGGEMYSDCQLFQLAFGNRQAMLPECRWQVHSAVVLDPAGNPFAVHRYADKFRLGHHDYGSRQRGPEMIRDRELPLEDQAFEFFAEYAALTGNAEDRLPGFGWDARTKRRIAPGSASTRPTRRDDRE